jgi:hypothetical protein
VGKGTAQTVSTDGSRRLYAVTNADGTTLYIVAVAMKLRGFRERRGLRRLFMPIEAGGSTQLLVNEVRPSDRSRRLYAAIS